MHLARILGKVFIAALAACALSGGCGGPPARSPALARGERNRVEVIAHRGFSGVAPENTLAAIREAIRIGADRVEFDVHLTADGIPVAIHDADLRRTAGVDGTVSSKTLAEIRRLDAGGWFHPDFRGESVPTLDEVLRKCRGRIAVNVEIKGEAVAPGPDDSPSGVEARVAAAIRRHGLAGTAAISSFEPRALERVRRAAPEIWLQSLYNKKLHEGLGPAAVCAAVGSVAFNCSAKEVTPEWIAEAHAAGISVNVYTVDEPAEFDRLLRLGVDGIITNRPDRLLAHLGRAPSQDDPASGSGKP